MMHYTYNVFHEHSPPSVKPKSESYDDKIDRLMCRSTIREKTMTPRTLSHDGTTRCAAYRASRDGLDSEKALTQSLKEARERMHSRIASTAVDSSPNISGGFGGSEPAGMSSLSLATLLRARDVAQHQDHEVLRVRNMSEYEGARQALHETETEYLALLKEHTEMYNNRHHVSIQSQLIENFNNRHEELLQPTPCSADYKIECLRNREWPDEKDYRQQRSDLASENELDEALKSMRTRMDNSVIATNQHCKNVPWA